MKHKQSDDHTHVLETVDKKLWSKLQKQSLHSNKLK